MCHFLLNFKKNILKDDIAEIQRFAENSLTIHQDRDDYAELLKLTLIFIGVSTNKVTLQVAGAMHHARWMSKAIYSLKIFILRDVYKFSTREMAGIRMICIFIVKIYVIAWFTAPLAIKAPNHDFQLIKSLYSYRNIDKEIVEDAVHELLNHMWYLSPENSVMALFDDDVETKTKQKIAEKLLIELEAENIDDENYNHIYCKKLLLKNSEIPVVIEQGLEQFINKNSIHFFVKIQLQTDWLHLDIEKWSENDKYQRCLNIVGNLSVVNDCVERAVHLMSEYNNFFTKNEDQKQFIVQIVTECRKKLRKRLKELLLKPLHQ